MATFPYAVLVVVAITQSWAVDGVEIIKTKSNTWRHAELLLQIYS